MRKKLSTTGLAVFAICALMAVAATAASAAPNWTVETKGGTVSIPGAGSTIPLELTTASTENAETTLEAPSLLTMKGKGLHLQEPAIAGEKTASVKKLTFTNLVIGNPNCQIKGLTNGDPFGTISTVPLTTELVTIGTTAYDTFRPVTGTVLVETQISAKPEKSCPVAGNYKVNGTINAAVPVSGTLGAEQKLVFSKSTEEATKASDKLTFGPGAIETFLTVTAILRQSNGLKFGADW